MIQKKAKKSLKLQKGLSRKPVRKHQQPVASKKVGHSVKASTARAKARKPIRQSAAEQAKSAVHLQHGTGKPSPAAAPKPVSPQLQELEKGRRRKQLLDQGYTLAKLAEKFGCSKSLVSNLVQLANLPDDLKRAYLEGRTGRKKVLEMARARKKKVEKKEAVTTEDSKNYQLQKPSPEPKAFVTANPQQNPPPKSEAVVAPDDLQRLLIRIAVPAMTEEEERQKRVAGYARLIIDWFRPLDLAPCFWQGFWSQVNAALYGPFAWLFADETPQPHEIRPGANPLEVIKECKVERKNPQFMTDIINDLVTWLARWVQRVISDRTMMEDAIDQARSQLLREARNAC